MIIPQDQICTFVAAFGTTAENKTITFKILDSDGTVLTDWSDGIVDGDDDTYITSGDVVELGEGEYGLSFEFRTAFTGFIRIKAVESGVDDLIASEPITVVSNYLSDIKRLLGLNYENVYIDTPVYDAYNNLTSARMRAYSVAASVGTDSNVIATYTITAVASGVNRFTTCRQVRS